MHFTQAKGILSASNGMNIYRGCLHGCIYCDSRSKCYQINHDFEDINVKENAIVLLENELKRKRNRCMISTGAMTDPYIPIEKELMYTKKCLELIYKYGFGVSILTKSDFILRDLELLDKINKRAKCVVNMTLTTYDEDLCKILEPKVSTTKERFEALKIFNEHNIKTVVWLDPILPFINDTVENLMGILNYCFEAKVYGIICFGFGLTLREGNREYFYKKLDEHFVGLKEKYHNKYGNSYEITSDNNNMLFSIFLSECKKHNVVCNNKEIFNYMHTFEVSSYEQLSFF